MNYLNFLAQFSTGEVILTILVLGLGAIVSYLFVKMNKLTVALLNPPEEDPISQYSKSVSKTVEAQVTQITNLEKQLSHYQREKTGLAADWAGTRNDKSAYLLSVYNDTPDKLFNLDVRIDPYYQSHSKVFWKEDKIDSEKSVNVFFIPGGWNSSNVSSPIDRSLFLRLWLDRSLEPIVFTVMYTETPSRTNFKSVEVKFAKEQLTTSMKKRLESLKTSPQLSVVPPKP